jgi:hypothetical protein
VEALFDLLTLLRSGTVVNLTFLRTFLSVTVPAIYSIEEKKAVPPPPFAPPHTHPILVVRRYANMIEQC